MSNRYLEDSLALMAGAAAGAALMYLFDPATGADRREHIGELAGDALSGTGTTLGSAFQTVADSARNLTQKLAEHAGDLTSDATAAGSSLVGNIAERLRSSGASVSSSVASSARDMMDRKAEAMGYHRESFTHRPVVQGVGALTFLALGVGAMYLFDPERGRTRRAWLGQKIPAVVRDVGEFARATGQHLTNRAKGVCHQAGDMVSSARDSMMHREGGSDEGGDASMPQSPSSSSSASFNA